MHEWFGKTIIHSNRRFTYEEAQERIETGEGDFAEEINILNNIAKKLREERYASGSISFESEEVQFILDEESKPTGMYVRERKEAHMLIEDFMLLANKRVATYIATKAKPEIPFIYRIQDLPNPDKLSDLHCLLQNWVSNLKWTNPSRLPIRSTGLPLQPTITHY